MRETGRCPIRSFQRKDAPLPDVEAVLQACILKQRSKAGPAGVVTLAKWVGQKEVAAC